MLSLKNYSPSDKPPLYMAYLPFSITNGMFFVNFTWLVGFLVGIILASVL